MQHPTGTPVSTPTADLSRRWIDKAQHHLTPAPNDYGWERTPSEQESEHIRAVLRTDAAIGAGHALLAIGAELSEIRAGLADVAPVRGDLAGIATAVRELTGALTAASQPVDLVDVSNSIADVRTEVAEVAAAVRELAEAIRDQQQPRRRWFSRGTVGA